MTDRAAHAFQTTNWTQVVAAGGNSPIARQALRELCDTYYAPVELFVRRFQLGKMPVESDDARDMTHEFFAKLLEGNSLSNADHTRGRFRSYLLGAVKNFLRDQYDRKRTLKRGGEQALPLFRQTCSENSRVDSPAPDIVDQNALPPDAYFDRQWALSVVEHAINTLRVDSERIGELARFEVLQRWLVTPSSHTTAVEAARSLNLSDGAFKVAVHRLRKQFRHIVVARIATTVDDPCEVQDELNALIHALTQNVP